METILFEYKNKQVIQQGKNFFTRVLENGEFFESGDFNTFERAKKNLGIESTVAENNILIAEFMGLKIVGGYLQKYIDSNTKPKQYWEGKPKNFEHQICGWQITHHESKIQYHSDWNWLMEVVEKIESTKTDSMIFDIFITKNKTHIHYSKNNEWFSNIFLYEGITKIENAYNACVEFINWYNEQEKE